MKEKEAHWQKVYAQKEDREVSWYQEKPGSSLQLIEELSLAKDAAIIDVGGGNSELTAQLLERGYENLSVLDISANALERTQAKLGEAAQKVNWHISDVLHFKPQQPFQLWHDRATFHFLTAPADIEHYLQLVGDGLQPGGYLILATFASDGPEKCSGLPVSRYSASELEKLFADHFKLVQAFEETHHTPFDTQQQFQYTVFKRKE